MRLILFIAILLYSVDARSQVQPVQEAEKAFARFTLDSGIRKGFLSFLDTTALIVQQGEIQSAWNIYHNSPEIPNRLIWAPEFYGESLAGDLGFTTGPYELRTSSGDSLLASGQYTTVWKKNAQGVWKVLFDIGTGYARSRITEIREIECNKNSGGPFSDTALFKAENNFIRDYHKRGTQAFAKHAAPDAWYNTNGIHPIHSKEILTREQKSIPENLNFIPMGGGVAISHDLAYVYGQLKLDGRKEAYLRIWTYDGKLWKILVQVLRIPE